MLAVTHSLPVKAVKISEPTGLREKFFEEMKPLSEADWAEALRQQGQEKISTVFRVDGKIVAAQYKDGSIYVESDSAIVQPAIDRAFRDAGDAQPDPRVIASGIEAALKARYGTRLSVATNTNGLQMNAEQLMASIQKQRGNKW